MGMKDGQKEEREKGGGGKGRIKREKYNKIYIK